MSAKCLPGDRDVLAWSRQQADFPRAGKLAQSEIEYVAEEIGSMCPAEKRGPITRLGMLLLLFQKWR